MDTSLWINLAGVIISGLIAFIVSSMRIGEYKNKVDTLEKQAEKHEKGLQEVRDKAIACETSLKEREPLTKKRSPVSLTERGNKILTESGGEKFVNDNFDELKGKVEETKPQTSYDVQESSKQVIENSKTDARINPLKEYLYKEGLEWDDLAIVLGIYLRDKVLISKNWNSEDIDKYDPTNAEQS